MSEPLNDDQKFFREHLYNIKGFGFALFFVVGTIALNGEPGRFALFDSDERPLDKATFDRTAIFLGSLSVIGVFWPIYCFRIRSKLPDHPTVTPKGFLFLYCTLVLAFLGYVGYKMALPDPLPTIPASMSEFIRP